MATSTALNYRVIGKPFTGEKVTCEIVYDVTAGDSGVAANDVNLALCDDAIIITKCTAHVETAFVGGGTLNVGIRAGDVDAMLAGPAAATLVDNYVVQTAAAQGLYVAADSYIYADPVTTAFTAGRIVFTIEYVLAR